jgi:hypothetical protein
MDKVIAKTFKVHLTTCLFFRLCLLFLEWFRSCIDILQNRDNIISISVSLARSYQEESFIPISNRMILLGKQEIDLK